LEVRGDPFDFMPVYTSLTDKSLKNAVDDVKTQLQNDVIVGDHVRRSQIPKYYIKKHNVQVLYREELPGYWRLIYTIMTFKDGEKRAILLELFNHDVYNKRFGYT